MATLWLNAHRCWRLRIGGRRFHIEDKHAGSGLLVSEHRQFAFADRHCLTAMRNQPKQLLRILHIFVAYLMIGDCR